MNTRYNTEEYDDNLNQQSYILGLIKNVNERYDQEIKEDNNIDKYLLNKFKSLYDYFTYQLFNLTTMVDDYVQDDDEDAPDYLDYYLYTPKFYENIDSVISAWNSLVVLLIGEIKYQDLTEYNKNYIDNKLTKLSDSVLKIAKNFKNDIDNGSAHITSQYKPSNLLINNLFELAEKLAIPNISLIKFKSEVGELAAPAPASAPASPAPVVAAPAPVVAAPAPAPAAAPAPVLRRRRGAIPAALRVVPAPASAPASPAPAPASPPDIFKFLI